MLYTVHILVWIDTRVLFSFFSLISRRQSNFSCSARLLFNSTKKTTLFSRRLFCNLWMFVRIIIISLSLMPQTCSCATSANERFILSLTRFEWNVKLKPYVSVWFCLCTNQMLPFLPHQTTWNWLNGQTNEANEEERKKATKKTLAN